jgi:hypothetical protein
MGFDEPVQGVDALPALQGYFVDASRGDKASAVWGTQLEDPKKDAGPEQHPG